MQQQSSPDRSIAVPADVVEGLITAATATATTQRMLTRASFEVVSVHAATAPSSGQPTLDLFTRRGFACPVVLVGVTLLPSASTCTGSAVVLRARRARLAEDSVGDGGPFSASVETLIPCAKFWSLKSRGRGTGTLVRQGMRLGYAEDRMLFVLCRPTVRSRRTVDSSESPPPPRRSSLSVSQRSNTKTSSPDSVRPPNKDCLWRQSGIRSHKPPNGTLWETEPGDTNTLDNGLIRLTSVGVSPTVVGLPVVLSLLILSGGGGFRTGFILTSP
ncbi:hypothetical protein B0T16DRAFT_440659 [Cercophora newfieldiana]|uniref:Uncharacterized protein n=1 Tax=Cercophora newfieldiana TaxID=92897 RepID=A0AA40CXV9_9PEZI|nr:hypothetical protein B0T16DRAFT_440659 [Cercophora newfieldiana]